MELTPVPTPTTEGPQPIIVGVAMAETGVMARFDRPAIVAARYEVERINTSGGVLGRPLELRHYDSESRQSVTQSVAERLVREGAEVFLVSCDPDFARPAIDVANEAGLLTISPCSSDPGFATSEFGTLAFSMSGTATNEGLVLADYVFEKGARSVALIVDVTSPEASTLCNAFEVRFTELGGFVTFRDEFTYDALDPFEERLKSRNTAMDGAILCSHLPGGVNGAPVIIDLLRSYGVSAPLYGGSTLDGPGWTNLVGTLGELTIVVPASNFGDDPNSEANAVLAAAREELGPDSRAHAVYGADSVDAFARAAGRAGTTDGAVLAAEMESFRDEPFRTSAVSFGPGVHMDTAPELRVVAISADGGRLIEVRSVNGGGG